MYRLPTAPLPRTPARGITVIVLLCTLLTAILLAGCGGGDNPPQKTTATITISWPALASIAEEIASVKVEVSNGSYHTAQIADRQTNASSDLTFIDVPLGTLTVTTTAFSVAGGQGTVQAVSSAQRAVSSTQPIQFSVQTAPIIDRIDVTAPKTSLAYQETVQLTAIPKSSSDIVLVEPENLTWSTSDAQLATVNTETGLVTAVGAQGGQVTMTVTEATSGRTGACPLTVRGSGPPEPSASAYAVITENYHYLYNTAPNADRPFAAYWQFTSGNFPIPVSYEANTVQPSGFDLVSDTEHSFLEWAAADPRVAMISGVTPAQARIRVILQTTITYGGYTNIIGLTTVQDSNRPSFTVEVATKYLRSGGNPDNPGDYYQMPVEEIQKTLAHELGHALGLGHSPDRRDLMYYMANIDQGDTFERFFTYGDAMALWSSFTERNIAWYPTRPTITRAAPRTQTLLRSSGDARGDTVVDIYTKP